MGAPGKVILANSPRYRARRPKMSDTRKSTKKTTNRTFAIHAAVPAMPANPRKAAISATTKKIIDQLNILISVSFVVYCPRYPLAAGMPANPLSEFMLKSLPKAVVEGEQCKPIAASHCNLPS